MKRKLVEEGGVQGLKKEHEGLRLPCATDCHGSVSLGQCYKHKSIDRDKHNWPISGRRISLNDFLLLVNPQYLCSGLEISTLMLFQYVLQNTALTQMCKVFTRGHVEEYFS